MRCAAKLLILLTLVAPAPAFAQDEAAIQEIRDVWAGCTAIVDAGTNDWVGWHRNFDGGYADFFEFWDRRGGEGEPSVLRQQFLIDAIATQTDISCFRADGTLAFIFTTTTSPNMAVGFDAPAITREGQIYFGPDGEPIRVLQQITEDGKRVADADDDKYQLARGCNVQLHPDLDTVDKHVVAELGDLDGSRPPFEPASYDWCSHEGE